MYIRRKVFSVIEPEEKLYGEVKRANKAAKKAWEWSKADPLGRAMMKKTGFEMTKGDAIRAQRLLNVAETHGGVAKYIDGDTGKPLNIHSEAIGLGKDGNPKRNIHHRINTRAINKDMGNKIGKTSFIKDINQDAVVSDLTGTDNVHANSQRYETMRSGGKREKLTSQQASKGIVNENKVIKKAEEAVKDQAQKKGFKLSRNQKIGAAALGTAAVIGAGTYAYKKHKKSKEKKD